MVRFRVVNATGGGVPGHTCCCLRHRRSGFEGVTLRAQDSDAQGFVSVQAVCPSRMIGGGRIQGTARRIRVPKSLAVEVQAGVVHRVEIMPHGQALTRCARAMN